MQRTEWMRRALLGVTLSAATSVIACGGESTNAPPPATAATTPASGSLAPAADDDDEVADGVREQHRHHHHGGVTMFIAMSLDTLGVSPEQRAQVEKIQSDLYARLGPARAAEHTVISTLADGVAAGSVDQAKVDAALGQLTTAAGSVSGASADALNQLHTVLTHEQRAALVDKVEAHWEVWRRVNSDEQPGARERGGRLAKLAERDGLTPDQVEKISAALGQTRETTPLDPKEVEAQLQAFGTAFAADNFDARTLAPATDASSHVARSGAARMARFYEAAAPILTPEQRTKVAEHLRDHLAEPQASSGT
jgi:Spy/CpxP family protein refolding chaperone